MIKNNSAHILMVSSFLSLVSGYSVLIFFDILPMNSLEELGALIVFSIILCQLLFVLNISCVTLGIMNFIFFYYVVTHFGLVLPYIVFGKQVLSNYSDYTIRFLQSEFFYKAIVLSLLGMNTFCMSLLFGHKQKYEKKIAASKDINLDYTRIVHIAYAMLLIFLLFLIYSFLKGEISFLMSYIEYRNEFHSRGYYGWLLFIYAVGIIYLFSIGNRRQIKRGLILFGLSSFILFATGCRSAVFYAAPVCFGIYFHRGKRINYKIVLVILLILFIIPIIASARSESVLHNITIQTNFLSSFTELGMQIRVPTYLLEEYAMEAREYLNGYSYIYPLYTFIDSIFLFLPKMIPPSSYYFGNTFATMGFTPVAVSYANFGFLGVLIFHFAWGSLMRKLEEQRYHGLSLALYASVAYVFVNMTRNNFHFVPGQIITLVFIFFVIKHIASKNNFWSKSK